MFESARAHDEPSPSVHIIYRDPSGDPEANVNLDVTLGDREGGYGAPLDQAQEITVNGVPALYVHGVWQQTHEGRADDQIWDPAADHHMLSWQANGFTCILFSYRLGLSEAEMIRIAESIQSEVQSTK